MARLFPGGAADRSRSPAEARRRRGPLAIARADVAGVGVGGAARAPAGALVLDAEIPVPLAAVALEDAARDADQEAIEVAARDDVEADGVARTGPKTDAKLVVAHLILAHGGVGAVSHDQRASAAVAQDGVVFDHGIVAIADEPGTGVVSSADVPDCIVVADENDSQTPVAPDVRLLDGVAVALDLHAAQHVVQRLNPRHDVVVPEDGYPKAVAG